MPYYGDIAPEAGDVVRVVQGSPEELALIRADIEEVRTRKTIPLVFSNPVERAAGPYSRDVVGVVSTQPAFLMSAALTGVPLALSGRVPCKVTLEGGPIRVGDLLTTSSTPGHAMKANEPWRGGIIGTALEAFDGAEILDGTETEAGGDRGRIIMLPHLNPAPSADPAMVSELQKKVSVLEAKAARAEAMERRLEAIERAMSKETAQAVGGN